MRDARITHAAQTLDIALADKGALYYPQSERADESEQLKRLAHFSYHLDLDRIIKNTIKINSVTFYRELNIAPR